MVKTLKILFTTKPMEEQSRMLLEAKNKIKDKGNIKMEEIKVRENLNDIVKEIALKKVKTRYSERKVCEVKFKNNEVVEFADSEGLYDLNTSYKRAGKEAFKTVKLVEEVQKVLEDEKNPKYICVAFECVDGETYRLFPAKRTDKARINLFYDLITSKE